MATSFYTSEELKGLGFKKLGDNVLVSRFARFYGLEEMEIGDNVRIDDFCILSGAIILGSNIHISAYSSLYGKMGIIMEDFTGLSPRCSLLSASDDFSGNYLIGPMIDPGFTNVTGGKILIKKYSQLGCNCVVLPGVVINEGVTVGAMSLIKEELEEWKIYAGIPTKCIKERSRELLKFLK